MDDALVHGCVGRGLCLLVVPSQVIEVAFQISFPVCNTTLLHKHANSTSPAHHSLFSLLRWPFAKQQRKRCSRVERPRQKGEGRQENGAAILPRHLAAKRTKRTKRNISGFSFSFNILAVVVVVVLFNLFDFSVVVNVWKRRRGRSGRRRLPTALFLATSAKLPLLTPRTSSLELHLHVRFSFDGCACARTARTRISAAAPHTHAVAVAAPTNAAWSPFAVVVLVVLVFVFADSAGILARTGNVDGVIFLFLRATTTAAVAHTTTATTHSPTHFHAATIPEQRAKRRRDGSWRVRKPRPQLSLPHPQPLQPLLSRSLGCSFSGTWIFIRFRFREFIQRQRFWRWRQRQHQPIIRRNGHGCGCWRRRARSIRRWRSRRWRRRQQRRRWRVWNGDRDGHGRWRRSTLRRRFLRAGVEPRVGPRRCAPWSGRCALRTPRHRRDQHPSRVEARRHFFRTRLASRGAQPAFWSCVRCGWESNGEFLFFPPPPHLSTTQKTNPPPPLYITH